MIKLEQIRDKDIYFFRINEDIDIEGVEKFIDFFAVKGNRGEKVKLIGEIKSIPGFENFKAFVETLEMKGKAMGAISKYAVLTDKEWIGRLVPFANLFTPDIPMKHFEIMERDAAIAWLESDEGISQL